MGCTFSTARELFEAVGEAVRDAERCTTRLDMLDATASGVGSPSFEPRVISHRHDGLERRVIAAVDERERLEKRIEEDYRLIDSACTILYGSDQQHDGLSALCPRWWADALYHHYLNGMSWAVVGELMGYTEQHVWRSAKAALEVADAHGMAATVAGMGVAES